MNARRKYVISRYSSEPRLAVAALYHLHEVDVQGERYNTFMVRDALVECHIDKGKRAGDHKANLIFVLYQALDLPIGYLGPSLECL